MTNQLATTDGMSPAEINEARRAGALANMLAREPIPETEAEPARRFSGTADAGPRGDQLGGVDAARLSTMSPSQVNQARRDGRLDHLLGIN